MKIFIIINLFIIFSCNAETVDKNFAFLTIELEKSRFEDVYKVFNKAELQKKGDASNFHSWVCFKTKDGAYLQFGSSEMGGGNIITEILLSSTPKSTEDLKHERCSSFSSSKKLNFDNGIGLGMKKERVIQLLGKPKDMKVNNYVYYFSRTLQKNFNELLTIEINFDNKGLLEKIVVSKVTSN